MRTLKEISLFLVLIFGCLFQQNQSAGSYFAKFLFAGFYRIFRIKVFFFFFENSKEIFKKLNTVASSKLTDTT